MKSAIAIVGIACQYPDAHSPAELWENVLAQRQAFRQVPPERLNLADYFSADPNTPDRTYAAQAALIEGYEFDRVGFRVPSSTYSSADLVHWLALDIAALALSDADFVEGKGLPHNRTGVLVGNTLTGEFSRANIMRLRWPYVRRMVEAGLMQQNWTPEQCDHFLSDLEARYKAPFPEIGAETLAGGLSNTIAGRICNYFNLKGGGYTLDGACSSSLLAIANACSSLTTGDLDVVLAGGVDLSLDPFELVGFAKTGALAPEKMRVYDARSAGFLPGEGCGFAVLMRLEDAIAQSRRIYATIRGWGISSDGNGGITRPEVEGQLLALQRAYHRAGFSPDTVAYFEGHGTGTSVGDATELKALSRAIQESKQAFCLSFPIPPIAIGSIKANIGHTKAAAGIAGLIKATMAVYTQILPPTTGCEDPHPELNSEIPALRVLQQGEFWEADYPFRAGVSAMGFGGINTHIVLEGISHNPAHRKDVPHTVSALSSAQDAELLLLSGIHSTDLQQQVDHLLTLAPRLSYAEVCDLATQLAKTLQNGSVRAAIVASSPQELTTRLKTLQSWLQQGITNKLDSNLGVFLGLGNVPPRIGFLFPGQASPTYLAGGAWSRRFSWVQQLYEQANLPVGKDGTDTAIAQPAIVTASIAGLQTLEKFGVTAAIAVGHSLGEITALHWSGGFDEATLLRIAKVRGFVMGELGDSSGKMASIMADHATVVALLNGDQVAIAGLNSPRQTVISGKANAITAVVNRARAQGLKAITLPVSHAFHSPLVAATTEPLADHLATETLHPLQRPVVSTVTGAMLVANEDLRALLCSQLASPVQFIDAVTKASTSVDLWVEVGSGRVLSGLVDDFVKTPVVSLDAGGSSLKGLLEAVGAAFALGAPINHNTLFTGRFSRFFNLDWHPRFFVNPCEEVDRAVQEYPVYSSVDTSLFTHKDTVRLTSQSHASALDTVRQVVAERTSLPIEAISDNSRLLSDLHLNSITVSQLVVEVSRQLSLSPPIAPTDYANATIAQVVQALEELARTGSSPSVEKEQQLPSGVDSWIQTFTIELVERPLRRRVPSSKSSSGEWQIFAATDHPLATSLPQAFKNWEASGGVVVCLPPNFNEHHLNLLLSGAKAVLAQNQPTRFVLVQQNGGGAALARTLHFEAPNLTTCVVDLPLEHPQALSWVLAEAKAAVGYVEAHYDTSGVRREPILRLLPLENLKSKIQNLKSNDLLLVTGGGKGIAAESALSLARETGMRLALIGRSQPDTDAELSANLERMAAAGIQFRYIAADVSDRLAVREAIAAFEAELGSITAILHGSGTNIPQLLTALDEKALQRTLAPKVQGLQNVLAAINPHQIKLLVTFGSIIARTGLRGEADYALANEWLAHLTERFGQHYPTCRCLTVEWSVWSGVGMGERLGRVDTLMQQGITPIPPDVGVSLLHRLIAQALTTRGNQNPNQLIPSSVVVTGRFGKIPTLKLEHQELPFLRFLERPRVYIPGVELVVDVELSADTDPYLQDHQFQGEQLFPAVMGLEAMAQVAMALVGTQSLPVFEDVKFNRPVVVPKYKSITIRIAALVRDLDLVEVVLRCEQTAFGVDHFQGVCRFNPVADLRPITKSLATPLSIDPKRDLYGGILFHQGRFQCLRHYQKLKAKECCAEIRSDSLSNWFGRYLPSKLVLGDPGARDAAIHAIQACIPHATLLPVAVERLIFGSAPSGDCWFLSATEIAQQGDTFFYDLEVIGADGQLLECWQGLQLQQVDSMMPDTWVAPMLVPYLERRVKELIPQATLLLALVQDASLDRRVRSEYAIQQAAGEAISVCRRPDGKPEVIGNAVSVAHADDLTLACVGSETVGCDIEPVVTRPRLMWQDLLGLERYNLAQMIVREKGEDFDTAATRIWAASECLKKAGAMVNAPVMMVSTTPDGWVLLASGRVAIATFLVSIRDFKLPLIFAVLVKQ